jgi:two-component system, cell cycle sensor histidine kinase and response regulator CckA
MNALNISDLSLEECKRLIHDLQAHRLELERQAGTGGYQSGVASNADGCMTVETRLEKELNKSQAFYDLALGMKSDLDLNEILLMVVEKSRRLFSADSAYIALLDEQAGEVYVHTFSGIRTDAFRRMRLPFGAGLGGKVAILGRGFTVKNYSKEIESPIHDIVNAEGLVSGMAVPMQIGQTNLGVLFVFNRTETIFSESDLDTLFLLGNFTAVEITRRKQQAELRQAHDDLEQKVRIRTAELFEANQQLRQEITDREKAEESLRDSESMLRSILSTSPVGIVGMGLDRKVKWVNEACLRMFGFDGPSEVVGQSTAIVYPSDEEYSRVGKALYEDLKLGRISSIDAMFKRKDGSLFDGQIRIKPLVFPEMVIAAIADISVRKSAEKELTESRQRLELALQGADLGLWDWNLQATQAVVNERTPEIVGYRLDEIEPTFDFWRTLVHPDDSARALEKVFDHLNGITDSYEDEYRVKAKSGEWKWVFSRGKVMERDSCGTPMRMIGTYLDITDRKRAEIEKEDLKSQLLQSQKMEAVGTLAGGIAHDFNNLLQVTQGYSEMLLEEKNENDWDYQDLLKINHAARKGAELVQRLLTFSRKVEPTPVPLDLNSHIVHVEVLLGRVIPKMINIQLELSSNLPRIYADSTQIEQVLMNLAVNARDAMPTGGKLTIGTARTTLDNEWCQSHVGSKPGEYVLLTVSDTGHGMDRATVDHIFEPFYTTKEIGRGTGLGLAIVYGIVRQHDGYITCSSETGKGTTFKVYLPAIESPVDHEKENIATLPASGTETVLLVDDETFIRELGVRILEKSGYKVLSAGNGKEALDVLQKHMGDISLVILDLIMPEMGGREFLEKLRKSAPKLKVLVASGHSSDVSVKESLDNGAMGFVSKPFTVKGLLKQVRNVLDGRPEF